MPPKTITKISSFVIPAVLLPALLGGCGLADPGSAAGPENDNARISAEFEKVRSTGSLESSQIIESSGLTASKCQKDVFWTHNDSGDGPKIFAIGPDGKDLGTWVVDGARNRDWEDIASIRTPDGRCFIYIGDIGDNARARKSVEVYKVAEPEVGGPNDNKRTERAEVIRASFPDGPRNSEALLVHPETLVVYLLTKTSRGASEVFAFETASEGGDFRLVKKGSVQVPAIPGGLITGADISGDGRRIVVCDYFNAYELALAEGEDFERIWDKEPVTIDIGERDLGEAVCYSADAGAIFATSEGKNSPVLEAERKSPRSR